LSGGWSHWVDGSGDENATIEPLSYVYQPENQFHGDMCRGSEACKVVLLNTGPITFAPKPN